MFRMREGDTSTSMQGFEVYDSISCIVIEMAFQQYIESEESQQYRYCQVKAGSTIDF